MTQAQGELRLLRVVATMAPLSERQRIAERLHRWLFGMDAHVLNPLPLDSAQHLRFQVVNEKCDAVLAQLAKEGWFPVHVTSGLRFCPDGARPAKTFEIYLENDRPIVADNRVIQDRELAEPKKKTDLEMEGMKKYLGLK